VNNPSTTSGPWRVLVLDRSDRSDPKWVLATVADPADVRPAGGADEAPDEVTTAWVRARNGDAPELTALPRALCWRVDDAAGQE
jgi:hypothetical protein